MTYDANLDVNIYKNGKFVNSVPGTWKKPGFIGPIP